MSKTLPYTQKPARKPSKTPAALADQHVLNAVLQGRKGGAHSAQTKRDRLAAAKLADAALE